MRRIPGPLKVSTRQDETTIHGYIALVDGSERIEVATLDLATARSCPRAFPLFMELLKAVLEQMMKDAGVDEKVQWYEPTRAHEKN